MYLSLMRISSQFVAFDDHQLGDRIAEYWYSLLFSSIASIKSRKQIVQKKISDCQLRTIFLRIRVSYSKIKVVLLSLAVLYKSDELFEYKKATHQETKKTMKQIAKLPSFLQVWPNKIYRNHVSLRIKRKICILSIIFFL